MIPASPEGFILRSFARARLALLICVTVGVSCIGSPDSIPEEWNTLKSTANGFSLRYPSEWEVVERCPDIREEPSDDNPFIYTCTLQPAGVRMEYGFERAFELSVVIERPWGGLQDAEDYLALPSDGKDGPLVDSGIEQFADRTWYVNNIKESVKDTTGACACVKRNYTSDHGVEAVFIFRINAWTKADWETYSPMALRIIRSVQFFEGRSP